MLMHRDQLNVRGERQPSGPDHSGGTSPAHQTERAKLNHRRREKAPRTDRPRIPILSGLPRKEVIQPHLPVQLPCYDFVPVTGPALGAGLPEGLAVRLQALPASMT